MTDQEFKLCRTVGALIKELEKLPKSTRLVDAIRPLTVSVSRSSKKGWKDEIRLSHD